MHFLYFKQKKKRPVPKVFTVGFDLGLWPVLSAQSIENVVIP